MSLILNQAQAAAVYSAMCALNNVGTPYVHIRGLDNQLEVMERRNGSVVVGRTLHSASHADVLESYESQAEFAEVYCL